MQQSKTLRRVLNVFLKKLLPAKSIQGLRDIRSLSRSTLYLFRSRISKVLGQAKPDIADDIWYQLQFKPKEAFKFYGIPVPNLPPDEVQVRFTGRMSHDNMRQAFSFYQYVRRVTQLGKVGSPKILDFGGGWGRIARLFLRDTSPERISIADCLGDSIHWLQATNNPCNIIKNETFPPISGLGDDFDLIYAFSVFSHLSESYQNAWVDYLMNRLRPGGYLVFTTRGHQFLEYMKGLHDAGIINDLTKRLPDPKELSERYKN